MSSLTCTFSLSSSAILPTCSQPIHTETADYPHHQPESFFSHHHMAVPSQHPASVSPTPEPALPKVCHHIFRKKPSSIIKDVFSHSLYWMPDNSLQFLRHCLPFIAQINTRLAKTCNIRFIILQNTSNLSASLGIIVFSFCNKIVIVSSNYLFS